MSANYTQRKDDALALPPVPHNPHTALERDWTQAERKVISAYGHACAEHVRAPLLARLRSVCQALVEAVGADGPCDAEAAAARAVARITELEADLREYIHGSAVVAETLKHAVTERDRLRAKVEALRADLQWVSLKWGGSRGDYAAWVLRRGGDGDLSDIRTFIAAARAAQRGEEETPE